MNQALIQKKWYKESEACAYLGIGRELLRAARDAGKVAYREWKGSRRLIYEKEELDRFVENDTNLYTSVEMAQREMARKGRKKAKE